MKGQAVTAHYIYTIYIIDARTRRFRSVGEVEHGRHPEDVKEYDLGLIRFIDS